MSAQDPRVKPEDDKGVVKEEEGKNGLILPKPPLYCPSYQKMRDKMARVTVEDCIRHVENRFELVLVGAQRAKSIASGAPLTIDRDGEKDPVIALREIAKQTVKVDGLRESLVGAFQKRADMDIVPQDDTIGQEEAARVFAADEMKSLEVDDFADENVSEDLSFAEENVEADD